MTNHLARLYTAAGTIIVFFLLWVTIAAHPWATTEQATPQDPRLVALAQREKRLQKRAADVKRVIDRRWAVYERRAAQREWQNSVALQRHVRQLEASQATAVRAARAAVAQTAQASAYAASVVAWANQQLQAAGPTAAGSAAAASTPTRAPAPAGRSAAPPSGRSSVSTPAAEPAPIASATPPTPAPGAPVPAPAAPPPAAAAPGAAPAATPTPAAAPVAAPPVQVVTLPPVTATKVSKKK